MRLLPKPGATVIDPSSRGRVPPEGIEVAKLDTYWARRMADGSVSIAPEPAAPRPERDPQPAPERRTVSAPEPSKAPKPKT